MTAFSLSNLGGMLFALGRREEALAATQEAVAHYRELAAAHLQAFRPDQATNLHNLRGRLKEAGRREEAVAAYEEALRPLDHLDRHRRLRAEAPSRSRRAQTFEMDERSPIGSLKGRNDYA